MIPQRGWFRGLIAALIAINFVTRAVSVLIALSGAAAMGLTPKHIFKTIIGLALTGWLWLRTTKRHTPSVPPDSIDAVETH